METWIYVQFLSPGMHLKVSPILSLFSLSKIIVSFFIGWRKIEDTNLCAMWANPCTPNLRTLEPCCGHMSINSQGEETLRGKRRFRSLINLVGIFYTCIPLKIVGNLDNVGKNKIHNHIRESAYYIVGYM